MFPALQSRVRNAKRSGCSREENELHCERSANNYTILNHGQSVARSIEAVAKRVPAAPKEEGNTARSHAAAIDSIKITSYKYGKALSNYCLHAAAGHSETERLPGQAVPTGDS
jgi:hypothetical protein